MTLGPMYFKGTWTLWGRANSRLLSTWGLRSDSALCYLLLRTLPSDLMAAPLTATYTHTHTLIIYLSLSLPLSGSPFLFLFCLCLLSKYVCTYSAFTPARPRNTPCTRLWDLSSFAGSVDEDSYNLELKRVHKQAAAAAFPS